MSPQRRSSIYRDALQVSPERIARISDEELNVLMADLLRVQAHKCRSPRSEVRVNTEGKAKDGGCDGWSARPEVADDWLGSTDTCWQFKAGTAGNPSRLRGEIAKPIPTKTLHEDGRFVVVTSGSTNGKRGETDRLKVLVEEATRLSIPATNIEVLGSERLTNWCNQHPAVAAKWAGRPAGLLRFEDWANSEVHQVTWQATDSINQEIVKLQADMDLDGGSILHLHIHGQPGVGKTRFALELCRGAGWVESVIYIPQASDVRLLELIDSTADEQDVHLTIVADEVQLNQLTQLRDSISRANGRIRLISVGHCKTPDRTHIPAYEVLPLDPQSVRAVVKGWHPAMPQEHIDFIAQFAQGYVRLVKLAADAVALSGIKDVSGLLERHEIQLFFDKMLGDHERLALYVVAVLSSIGWKDDKQIEGETVAKHLGLEWNKVRNDVELFHTRFGIVPRGGRYRYISPIPLGIHLAVEAWDRFPDLLRSLPDVLPSEDAKEAYYERLQSMVSTPEARVYAREELSNFFRPEDFLEEINVKRWAALSTADPEQAARGLFLALSKARIETIEKITDGARRELVWTLVRLAWRPLAFDNSVKSLALLAEAENERWSNNATGEFIGRFQVYLGGTAVPYLERLIVLDDLLALNRPALNRLVVQALARASESYPTRMGINLESDALVEEEWLPRTGKEHFECIKTSIERLCEIAKQRFPGIQGDLITAAQEFSMLLRDEHVRPLVITFYEAVRQAYTETREALRRCISEVVNKERKYWNDLDVKELAELDALHSSFEDSSLQARLRQHIGQPNWELEKEPDLKPLAKELLSKQEVIEQEWPFLTSPDAPNGWALGVALAKEDSNNELAYLMPAFANAENDFRIVCGYICTNREQLGDEWYQDWFNSILAINPKPLKLVFEVVWRCGVTTSIASKVINILDTENVASEIVGQLAYGKWGQELTVDSLEEVLNTMVANSYPATALAILSSRIDAFPQEKEQWQSLAIKLALMPEIIRANSMTNFYWRNVCKILIKDHPGEIALAIFREQADRKSRKRIAQYGDAAKVLKSCVEEDPKAVWEAFLPLLEDTQEAYILSIGFPSGIVDQMPVSDIEAWINKDPNKRAATIVSFLKMDFSNDENLASQLIEKYSDQEKIPGRVFSKFVSGSWAGPASSHWEELAKELDNVAANTTLPKLKQWSQWAASELRNMAERERLREEEEDLRGL
ncbi:hypothetical protein [Oceanidesulfovibrio marinus]|uniref:hypothetical protein n=1 Tax=Oceanidesulfovibrio marinus TaxID=370038 RepID=UPI0011833FFA|nr:hypothetical protein [Oceanidesulfovibrio marinus]